MRNSYTYQGVLNLLSILFFSVLCLVPANALCLDNQEASLLSVRFVRFEVSATQNSQVHVTWKTTAEYNSETYEIHRSTDLLEWEVIGTVAATGDLFTVNDYEFYDKRPAIGRNYYKMKHIGSDGDIVETDLVEITPISNILELAISPNPVVDSRGKVEFSLNESFEGNQINIYNRVGKQVMHAENIGSTSIYATDILNLEAGIYFVEVISREDRIMETMIIK